MNKIIKKALSLTIIGCLVSMVPVQALDQDSSSTGLQGIKELAVKAAYGLGKKVYGAGKHLLSMNGVKDAGGAYCLGMGLTGIHEFGHALMAKLFYGSPFDITLGAMPHFFDGPPIVKLGWLKLGGFNPATGYARLSHVHPNKRHPLKDAAISIAGPVFGAVASFAAFKLAQKSSVDLPLVKIVSLYGLFNHTLGIAGLWGLALGIPNHDLVMAVKSIREYRNKR